MMNTEWSTTTKQIVGIGLGLLGWYILYISSPVLPILIIAALMAFLMTPPVQFLHERLKIWRGLVVVIAYAVLIMLVMLVPLFLSGPITQGFQILAETDYFILIENLIISLQTNLVELRTVDLSFFETQLDLAPVIDPALESLQEAELRTFDSTTLLPSLSIILDYLRSAISVTFGMAASIAGTAFSWVVTLIVTLMCAIYMTLDAHKINSYLLSLVPPPYQPEVSILLRRLKSVWQSYIRGQTSLMIIIGGTTAFGNWMLGVPGAFALGFIAGILELFPYLGPFLAAIPAVVIALIQGSTYFEVSNVTFALMVAAMYLAIQQTENALVIPYILGDAVDLHPLVVTVGVVVGATIGGILGALVATPVIASSREVVGYLYAKILGQEPYPPSAETKKKPRPSLMKYGKAWLIKGRGWLRKHRA